VSPAASSLKSDLSKVLARAMFKELKKMDMAAYKIPANNDVVIKTLTEAKDGVNATIYWGNVTGIGPSCLKTLGGDGNWEPQGIHTHTHTQTHTHTHTHRVL
jgi:hypothetical protein